MIRLDKKNISDKPGIYFFRDNKRQILYIGKAAKLRNRLGSYFDSQPKDPRISKMLKLAASVDYILAGSEIEALILESQSIKKHKPPFNIMLRDDKQYFFVVFTKEMFSRIFLTHQPANREKFEISGAIGPFTDGSALKLTLKLLRKIFPYCTCKQKHNNYCLNYHIGKCLGFCCLSPVRSHPAEGVITATSGRPASNGVKNPRVIKAQIKIYKNNVRAIKNILSGQRVSLVKKLEKEMTQKGEQNSFEEAIKLRNQIEKIKQVFENAQIIHGLNNKYPGGLDQLTKSLDLPIRPTRIEGYDISNIQGEFATGAMVVFTDGEPDRNQYRKFKINGNVPGDTAMLQEMLIRRFKHSEWQFPNLILTDGGKSQLNAANIVLQSLHLEIPIIALTKNEKHIGDHILTTTRTDEIKLAKLPKDARNIILHIDAEAHRFAINYYRKLHKSQL